MIRKFKEDILNGHEKKEEEESANLSTPKTA